MTPADDLDRLLAAAADGELTQADQYTLAALLRDDPAAQRSYREYMLLDSHLRWEYPAPPATPAVPRGRTRGRGVAGLAVAAGLLAAVGAALWFGVPAREAVAGPDVVTQLTDWNLAVADARSPAERREVYVERAAALAVGLAESHLPPDERQLADALYERAHAVAEAADAADMAEQLDGMSDELHRWLLAHAEARPRRAAVIEQYYFRAVDRSLSAVAVTKKESTDARRLAKVESVIERMSQRSAARAEKDSDQKNKKPRR